MFESPLSMAGRAAYRPALREQLSSPGQSQLASRTDLSPSLRLPTDILRMGLRPTSLLVLLLSYIVLVLADEDIVPVVDFQNKRLLEYKTTNVLQCNITGVPPSLAGNFSVKWLREDKVIEISADEHPKYEPKRNKLYIHRTKDEDIVRYSCLLLKNGIRVGKADIETYGIPTVKVVSQGTFIEGQKITLECVVTGKPLPVIEWKFGNKTLGSSKKVSFLPNSKDMKDAILQIDNAEMSDRGFYTCSASNEASEFLNQTIEHKTFVRVKDKLAALWPFIGICAEVVVLCAIIFIYERKRNKAELDESDTDQSPEQKNTPDHGKESVRQRK